MPLTVTIPGVDIYDPRTNRFITTKTTTLTLEHSLLSISKWEAKWHKPYFTKEQKSEEESLDYLRCMCLTKDVDPKVFLSVDGKTAKIIADYISNPMTATTFRKEHEKPSREIVTSELVYYWMTEFGIPFDPCEKWHLNRLMTLIRVASVKSQPPKKMSRRELMQQNSALNAQRRAKYRTRG